MNINKINHSFDQYECGKGIARVNIYNGNLLFDYPLIHTGINNYQIDVTMHYNSNYKNTDFSGKKIGFGNGWKLNIQQYLFKYKINYRLDDFYSDDYIYIDSNWNIHKFVRYNPVNITNVYPHYYYDESGSGLRLEVNEDGSAKIFDYCHNAYLFNTNGNLTDIISGVNSNIIKKLTYDENNNVTSIYDNRKTKRKISFYYNENQELIKARVSTSKISYNLEYDNNRLINIYKLSEVEENDSAKTYSKKEMNFVYDDDNLMLYSINSLDLTGLKYNYSTEDKVSEVNIGVIKSTIITDDAMSCIYVGENIYVNDEIYPVEAGIKFKEYEVSMPEEQIKDKVSYYYATNYTKITNNQGISINNYFNLDGRKISELEVKNDNEYYSLFKNNGWLLPSNALSTTKINKESCIELTSNNLFEYTINELKAYIESLKLDEDEESDNINDSDDKIEHIKVSFWLNTVKNNTINMKVDLKCYFEEVDSHEEVNFQKKALIEKTLDDVWQYVTISIPSRKKLKKLRKMTISIDGGYSDTKVLISDIRLEYGGLYDLMLYEGIGDTYQEYKVDIDSIIGLDNNLKVISSQFYLTENDLLVTYKNIYMKEEGKPFDFVCCNGTKVYSVNRAYLKVNNQEIDFTLNNENTCNYYYKLINLSYTDSWIISEIQTRFHYDSNMKKHYYETKRAIGRLEGDEDNRLSDDNCDITYEWVNEDGTFRANKNVDKIITEYFYDDYGNIESIEVFKENNRYNNRVSKYYNYYYNEDDEEMEIYCYDNNFFNLYIYNLNEGILKLIVINDNNSDIINKVEYIYDTYNENITQIIFKDANDQIISINNLDNMKNGNIKKLFDSNNEKYLFYYNKLGDLTKVNVNNKYTLETEISKENNRDIITENIYYNEDSKDETMITKTTYDSYGRVEAYENNNQKATFKYENNCNSTLISRVNEIVDEFSNEVTNIEYFDEGKTRSKTITLKDKLKITTSSDNSLKYEILDDNELVTYKKINKDMLSNTVGKTGYIIEDKTTENYQDCGVFNYSYEYDDCNRLRYKKSDGIIYEVCNGNCEDVLEEVDGVLQHQYDYPDSTKYYFMKNYSYIFETNLIESVSCSRMYDYVHTRNNEKEYVPHRWISWGYNHEYEKGNLKRITEECINDKQIIHEYEYDASNRLTKETTTYQKLLNDDNNITNSNEYTYEYSTETGLLSKIIKKETDLVNNIEKTNITKIKDVNEDLTNENDYDKIYEIQYDQYGNIISDGYATMTYNSRNLMDSYSYSTEGLEPINYKFEYYYNYQGVRYQKKKRVNLNGRFPRITYVNYHLNGSTILGEDSIDEDGNFIYRFKYFYDIEGICGIRYNGCNFELIKDSTGNVSKIIYDGTVVGEYEYDAWGNCKVIEDLYFFSNANYEDYYEAARFVLLNNPFRYKGYYYDVETQLFYCNSRYYSPELCRFISPDSVNYLDPHSINGLNLYCYCFNNPIMYADPSGHFPFLLLTALVGLAIGAGVGLGVGLSNGHTGWELAGDIALGGLIGGVAGLAIGAGVSGLLTGSFFSSVGAVKTGAVLTYQMAKVGGLGAAMVMMGDNFSNAIHHTTHVFWSGGDISMNGGNYLAKDVGGTTLEMTRLGQYLTNHSAKYEAWKIASANFANQVPNGSTVFAMQNINGISITSTWATTEYPILVRKAVEIIYEIIGGI